MFKSLEKYSIMLKEVVLNIKLLIVYILNEGDILNIYIAIVLGLILYSYLIWIIEGETIVQIWIRK